MTFEVRRFADQVATPWGNGHGVTREFVCVPPGSEFDWRVSVADVSQDGPFSAYPGVDRVIVLCEGPSMTIDVEGTEHMLVHQAPFSFSGDSTTTCRVPGGPTRDLNVMTRRDRCAAEVSVLHGRDVRVRVEDGGHAVVVVLAGAYRAQPTDSDEEIRLGVLDTLLLNDASEVRIVGAGALTRIDVHPAARSV